MTSADHKPKFYRCRHRLVFSIGVELFFFGNLGVPPNLWLTGVCVVGVGLCTWWTVRCDRRLAARPMVAPAPSNLNPRTQLPNAAGVPHSSPLFTA
ncbi:MAG: hypothetical protein ACR2JY_22185 [Chloroflexota bacterium]